MSQTPEPALSGDEQQIDALGAELARQLNENAKLHNENAALRDALHVAKRRIRVLRGVDVLTTASSRGVVIWLKAIRIDAITYGHSVQSTIPRHIAALIETLEGAE